MIYLFDNLLVQQKKKEFPADDADERREEISGNLRDQREKKKEKFPADNADQRRKRISGNLRDQREKKTKRVSRR